MHFNASTMEVCPALDSAFNTIGKTLLNTEFQLLLLAFVVAGLLSHVLTHYTELPSELLLDANMMSGSFVEAPSPKRRLVEAPSPSPKRVRIEEPEELGVVEEDESFEDWLSNFDFKLGKPNGHRLLYIWMTIKYLKFRESVIKNKSGIRTDEALKKMVSAELRKINTAHHTRFSTRNLQNKDMDNILATCWCM